MAWLAPLKSSVLADRPYLVTFGQLILGGKRANLGFRAGAKVRENFVNNFQSGTIKGSMLFGNSAKLCLAMRCRAPEVDNIWPKERPFTS